MQPRSSCLLGPVLLTLDMMVKYLQTYTIHLTHTGQSIQAIRSHRQSSSQLSMLALWRHQKIIFMDGTPLQSVIVETEHLGALVTEDLARRAIAAPHWRWMPGMLTDVGERVTDPTICYLGTLPDLDDPATLGCLLALVREAWGFQAFVALTSGGWHVWGFPWEPDLTSSSRLASGPTEAEALVAALEAAP